MNLLSLALTAVSGLSKTISTRIYNRATEIVDGVARFTVTEITARVHAQPLSMKELKSLEHLIGSSTMLKFYIVGNKADVVDFFRKPDAANSIVEWDGGEYISMLLKPAYNFFGISPAEIPAATPATRSEELIANIPANPAKP